MHRLTRSCTHTHTLRTQPDALLNTLMHTHTLTHTHPTHTQTNRSTHSVTTTHSRTHTHSHTPSAHTPHTARHESEHTADTRVNTQHIYYTVYWIKTFRYF